MSDPPDDPFATLIRQLDEASEMLASLPFLTGPEAERIGARLDRLTSEISSKSPSVDAGVSDDVDRAS
jgi:hypothetical protein